jgi:hypothetical protein
MDTIVHGLSAGIGGTIHTYISGKYQHAAVHVETDCASTNTSAGHIHTNRNLASGRTGYQKISKDDIFICVVRNRVEEIPIV